MQTGSSDTQFADFVRAAKGRGLSDEFIVSLLGQNGWSQRRIYRSYSAYYETELGLPLPARPASSGSPRDAFFYLLNFITLGFWTVALGKIFFDIIARAFPDPTQNTGYGEPFRREISWQLAVVIVAFPIFAFIHLRIQKELRARPDLYESGVRRWLTYIALVIAALIVLGDAIWFIDALLTGELTIRFLLDSLILILIAGGVFAYYLKTIDAPATNEA